MSSITVVGGGISGLSAAFHLARRFPAGTGARITLVEKAQRLGGWVRAERVRVDDGHGRKAEILLESGPRTLRPNSKAILELINLLNLAPSLLTVPRSAPAARNRFLHFPGTDGLVTIPTSIFALLRSPLAKTLLSAVAQDTFRRRNTGPREVPDESIDAFLTRHFGVQFAQSFGSALVHGIYAADSRILSVRAAFPALCLLEENGGGSVVRGAIKEMLSALGPTSNATTSSESYELGNVPQLMKGVSVYSFRDGMQTLTDAMVGYLRRQPHVDIVTGDSISALSKDTDRHEYEVSMESGKRIASSHIVTAIPLPSLHQLLIDSSKAQRPNLGLPLPSLPHLLANPTSSVTVVNMVFPPTSTPIHPSGFGYLIPRPPTDYRPSSLGMLGTVFDSCALSGQDTDLSPTPSPAHAFTKLTVMLGGPHGAPSPTPSSPAFVPALLAALQAHLGRAEALPAPCAVRVREHRACIPTPGVGHAARMRELAEAVRARWGPGAAVIGAGVGGVSVGDCVEGGRRAALALQV